MYNNLKELPNERVYKGEDIEKDYHIAIAMLKNRLVHIGKLKSYIAELEYNIKKLKSKLNE